MSDIQEFIDPGKPVSIRFTRDEAEFINENYERIADTTDRVTIRDFFFASIQKAVSRVAPKTAEKIRPQDAERIAALEAQLAEALADIESKAAAIDEIVNRNVELEHSLAELETQYAGAVNTARELEAAATEASATEQARRQRTDVMVLEDMLPAETALVMEYARLMKTTPKVVLVEKLFTPTVWHGPGDYIPRLNGEAKRKIREAFQ